MEKTVEENIKILGANIQILANSQLNMALVIGKHLRLIEVLAEGHPNRVRILKVTKSCLEDFENMENGVKPKA